jgi:glycerophosphoryl diester phosphodiesterase
MRRTIIPILFSILVLACKKEEFKIENLNNNTIVALGHGGMGVGNTYPMNSFESLLRCLNLGMDGTEFDVQLSKDSILIAFHDPNLSSSTTMNGVINSFYWSYISTAKYTQTPYLNYSLISLDQLFSHINKRQKYKFTFDCKLFTENSNTYQYNQTFINSIVKIAKKFNLEENIYIESQDLAFLQLFKNQHPSYKLFIYPSSFESGLKIATDLDLYGITISTRDITKEQIKIAHENNLYVAIWNTHTNSDNIEAIKKNPDFIQTDNVKSLIELIK